MKALLTFVKLINNEDPEKYPDVNSSAVRTQ